MWKIGLVGIGRGSAYGRIFHKEPSCRIIACCDSSSAALEQLQKEMELPDSQCFEKYDEFLSIDMDAVVIGTPIPVHAKQTVAALEGGINVLCELTAASNLADCERVVDAVRRTGKLYMLAENCIYWPFVQEWKQIVRSGRLGEIVYAECDYIHPVPEMIVDPDTKTLKWRSGRAPLHYCSHSLGPVLTTTADRIVRAMGIGNSHRIMPGTPEGGIDFQVGVFETEKGAVIKMGRSSVAPRHPPIHFYMLQGTKGYIETDRQGPSGKGWLYVAEEMETSREIECSKHDELLPEYALAGGHGTAEYSLTQDFLLALRTGRKPALNELRAMDLTAPGLVAHESAMQGGYWLEVPSFY